MHIYLVKDAQLVENLKVKKLLEILQEDILRQIATVIPRQELNGLKLMPL